MMNKQSNR